MNPSSLTEAQRHQILIEWNRTQVEYPRQYCIHQWIEDHLPQYSEAIAVVSEGRRLNYQLLNARANQLAHQLRAWGVGPDSLVGIHVERSIELIVGLLGILKAGGAYVPLDPIHPVARLTQMVDDAGIKVLLTQPHLPSIKSNQPIFTLYLDENWEDLAHFPPTDLPLTTHAENLAYVIYTSGSTGQPKGVAVPHRGVIRLLINTNYIDFRPTDRVAHVMSYSFDVAIFEIWGALLNGACLVIVNREILLSPADFAHYLRDQQVSVLVVTTALLNQIAQTLPTAFSTLRYLLFGGESAHPKWVKAILDHEPPPQIVHAYGPTEASVIATTYPVSDIAEDATLLPIGKPIANTECYVLDEQLQPVPPGVAGELYIGGDGLARGYLNQPELTAEKFIPHPFNDKTGTFLYKTGDRVRYRADGNIEFLGRVDRQIKLRGFRIELEEIEVRLKQNPQVRDALVIVQHLTADDERLVAYLIVAEETLTKEQTFTAQLLNSLKDQLPAYMIPAALVLLRAFPKTPNGKIDQEALPPPSWEKHDSTEEITFTPTEKILAQLWQQVLKVQRVGIHDNFFVLGGHSLLAIQLKARLHDMLRLDLPLRWLFDYPTLTELAHQIDHAQPGVESSPFQVEKLATNRFPLSVNQQSFWLFEQLYPGTPTYHIPFAFKLKGDFDIPLFTQALTEIAHRQPTLRTTFETDAAGNPWQRIQPLSEWPVITRDFRALQNPQEITTQHLNEAIQRPFTLHQDKLLRVEIFQFADYEHLLLLVFHHLITDGWSIGLFFNELTTLYQTLQKRLSSPLSPLAQNYTDFCIWQQQWLTSESARIQTTFWRDCLQSPLPVLDVPTDYLRPPLQTYRGSRHLFTIPPPLTQALRQFSQHQKVTLFMTVLAAFNVLLYRYTGQTDLLVGTAVAGRHQVEWEKIMGLFINNVIFRTYPDGQMPFSDYLQQVRQVALTAYQHQELPFQRLMDVLQPDRNLSHRPLFQCFFLLQNFELPEFVLENLEITPLTVTSGTAKFDLTLELYEKAEGLTGWFEYNTTLFKSATIERFAEHLQTLLADSVNTPTKSLSTLHLLSEAERRFLATRGNSIQPLNPFTPFPQDAIEYSIGTRFSQQVAQHPKQLAIVTQNYRWNYQELATRARALAYTLVTLNLQVDEKIGLLFEHDAEMLAAVFGVLIAGKVYVPLDPHHPDIRLKYILQNAQITVILTHDPCWTQAYRLAAEKLTVIRLADVYPTPPVELPTVSPNAVAYLLYTSGSTGQPKGVIQNHRNVLHFIRAYTNNLHIVPKDKLTLLSSYGFDAAVMDIFGALLNGATLCLFDVRTQGFSALARWLEQEKITLYHSTPTVYRHFLATLKAHELFSEVRLVVLGGEAVYKQDFDLYCQHFSKTCLFVNGLGPTESTVTLQYVMNSESAQTQLAVPAGYPVTDTEVFLANEYLEETEIFGEIVIKSQHVALGYWQHESLTKSVFTADVHNPGQRLYRTGDLGRLRVDGSIEFVGRKDSQIKIRGYRIELGEIEVTLVQHPAIREAVVTVHETEDGSQNLVAYLVLTAEIENLRTFLKERLPDYMIPNDFVVLEKLPLTMTGKINRRALPAPSIAVQRFSTPGVEDAKSVKPRNVLESQLSDIWKRILKIKSVGIHDNFFDLGGHSLLAVTLLNEIEKNFQKNIPLIALFHSPTIAQQADLLNKEHCTTHWRALEVIQPHGSRPPFFLMGNNRLGRALSPVLGNEQPLYGLNVINLQSLGDTVANIKDLANRCIKEIQIMQPQGPYYLGGYCIDAPVAFEMARQFSDLGQKVALLALFDAFINIIREEQGFSLAHHWLNLLDLGPSYVYKKMSKRWERFLRFSQLKSLGKLGEKLLKQKFSKQSLPEPIKYTFFENSYREQVNCYIPQSYSGHLLFFFASEWRLDYSAFNHLSTEEITICEIPGYHDELFVSPQVELLGKQLSHYLEKAVLN